MTQEELLLAKIRENLRLLNRNLQKLQDIPGGHLIVITPLKLEGGAIHVGIYKHKRLL